MFHVAGRCFAPAQITCPREARMLGCRVAARPDQAGLREIARTLAHPGAGRCERCDAARLCRPRGDLFFDLIEAADRGHLAQVVRALTGFRV
jgi:hypothetical protein